MERETTRVGVVDVGGGHHPRLEVVHGGGGEGGGFGAAAGGEGGIIGGGRGGDYVGDGGRGRRLGAATGRGGRHFGTERHVQQTRALFLSHKKILLNIPKQKEEAMRVCEKKYSWLQHNQTKMWDMWRAKLWTPSSGVLLLLYQRAQVQRIEPT